MELPASYRPAFAEAITKLSFEAQFQGRGFDFSPIIKNLPKASAGDTLLQNDPEAKKRETGKPEEPEKVRDRIREGEPWKDLGQFFREKEDRKYYVFIERFYHPGKEQQLRHDFLFVTEPLTDGNSALYVFDYEPNPTILGEDKKNRYIRLRLAATLKEHDEKVIYFDDGKKGNLNICLFSQSADRDLFIDRTRLYFKDPENLTTPLEVLPGMDFPIPTPDIASTVDYLLHFHQHRDQFEAFETDFDSSAKRFIFLQDFFSEEVNIEQFKAKYPSVAVVFDMLQENPGGFLRGNARRVLEEIPGLNIFQKQLRVEKKS